MKDYIEKLLLEKGCTDIKWEHGRQGWYVLVREYGVTVCYNIGDFINSYLDYEIEKNEGNLIFFY